MASSHDADRGSDSQRTSRGGRDVPAPTRRGSRLWTAVSLILFAAAVGSCCLCGAFLFRQWPTFQDDPAAAEELTRRLLSIEIPETFSPQGTIEWHVSFLLTMRGAYYSHTIDDGALTLLEVDSQFMERPAFRRHIIDSLHQHGAGSGFDLRVLQTESKTFEVAGEPVSFEFLTAEDRSTGEGRRLVDGVVVVSGAPVLVSLWVDEDIWDEEAVTRLIESIGPPAAAGTGNGDNRE